MVNVRKFSYIDLSSFLWIEQALSTPPVTVRFYRSQLLWSADLFPTFMSPLFWVQQTYHASCFVGFDLVIHIHNFPQRGKECTPVLCCIGELVSSSQGVCPVNMINRSKMFITTATLFATSSPVCKIRYGYNPKLSMTYKRITKADDVNNSHQRCCLSHDNILWIVTSHACTRLSWE